MNMKTIFMLYCFFVYVDAACCCPTAGEAPGYCHYGW